MKKQKCPKCNSLLLKLFGCGWGYDRLLCSNPKCDYEKELKTITYQNEIKK